jgi:hypothetical protein
VGDNLIMLDKRTEGGPAHGGVHNEGGLEGYTGSDVPPLGEPSQDIPF